MYRELLMAAALFLSAEPISEDTPRELPGLKNVHRASATAYLGSEPHGAEGFASLQKLGVTVIVSVDGAVPDVATAKKYGIRYIHIPIGYDGVPDDAAKALTRVAREVESTLYVHCHHGKHRGPAAAAVLCIAANSLSREQALEVMASAGTGKDYTGLWQGVRNFRPPGPETVLPELVEVAKVDSIAAAMAVIDRSVDNLKLCAKAGWKAPVDHPDLVPSAEALLIQEGLHECRRHLTADHDEQFRRWLFESETLAVQLYEATKANDVEVAPKTLVALEKRCLQCHAEYRNQ